MEKDKIYRKLAFLLEDKSMPSMVLLDGDWGSGKSYYLSNNLIPFLSESKKKKVVSFSLYGISNIDDFRDKLISACILKSKNATSILNKLTTSIVGATGFTNADNSSALLSIFNGIKGAAKHAVLSKIEKFTLILDDLERVDDLNLIKAILGECLQLAENNNIEVIVVANSKAIDKLDETLDKCISDRIVFSLTYEEAVKIAFENLLDRVTLEYLEKIVESTRALQIKNLRILKRCANRITDLIKELRKKPEIDVALSVNILIPKIISITHAYYQLGFSCEKIKENIRNCQSSFFLEQSETELSPEEEKTKIIFQLAESSSDDIIEFACGEKISACEVKDFGALPAKENLLDKLIYSGTRQISEAEFHTACHELLNYINGVTNVECYYWFNCLDTLDLLIKEKSIKKPGIIEGSVSDFAASKLNEVSFCELERKRNTPRRLVNEKLHTMMTEQVRMLIDRDLESSLYDLKTRMLKDWGHVDTEIFSTYEHKPFFNLIGADFLTQCLEHWGHCSILQFEDFMRARYNFSNISEFYSDEANSLKILKEWLAKKVDACQPSIKNGALHQLNSTLTYILKKLLS